MKKGLLTIDGLNGVQTLNVAVTRSVVERMRGLLWLAPLQRDQGMLLTACNLIHTFGMKYPIDIVFMRRDGRVLKICESIAPSRVRGNLRAKCVLELAAGSAVACGIHLGMRLPIETL